MIKNSFIRSVFILASGTALAQIINLAFIPIITRQYGPEAYGMMGSFMSVVNILIPLSALSYPIAVVLPQQRMMAATLVRLSLYLGVMVAATSLIMFFFVRLLFPEVINTEKFPLWFWMLIPMMLLILPFQQSGQQWLIRTRSYKQIAQISVVQAGILNTLRVCGGLLVPLPITLVLITAVGYLLQALQLFLRSLRTGLVFNSRWFCARVIKLAASRYYDFPLYRTPQVLVNSLSQSLPIFIIAWYFGAAEAGFYTLAQTILGAPVTLLSSAISNVYYPKVNEKVTSNEMIFPFVSKSTLLMLSASFLIYIIVIFCGPWLFSLIFGGKWHMAGEYGRWMAIYCVFWLGARPAIDSIPSLKIQHLFLVYELTSLILKCTALFAGVYFIRTSLGSMALFSIVNALAYFSLIAMVLIIAKKLDLKKMEECNAN